MKFLKDENFLVKHRSENIFLMVNHKWAFTVWEIERIRGNIKGGSTLFHIDTHLDDVPELIYNDEIYELSTESDINKFSKQKEEADFELRMDNFIFPSFVRDTINHIYYVSNPENMIEINQSHISIDDIILAKKGEKNYLNRRDTTNDYTLIKLSEIIEGKDKSIKRIYGIEEMNLIYTSEIKGSKILDLDLDYFNNSGFYQTAELKKEQVIISNLKTLKYFSEWDLITVALSPDFCGEEEHCIYLLNLFLKVFEISISDFEYYIID